MGSDLLKIVPKSRKRKITDTTKHKNVKNPHIVTYKRARINQEQKPVIKHDTTPKNSTNHNSTHEVSRKVSHKLTIKRRRLAISDHQKPITSVCDDRSSSAIVSDDDVDHQLHTIHESSTHSTAMVHDHDNESTLTLSPCLKKIGSPPRTRILSWRDEVMQGSPLCDMITAPTRSTTIRTLTRRVKTRVVTISSRKSDHSDADNSPSFLASIIPRSLYNTQLDSPELSQTPQKNNQSNDHSITRTDDTRVIPFTTQVPSNGTAELKFGTTSLFIVAGMLLVIGFLVFSVIRILQSDQHWLGQSPQQ